jgi:hypothetical protein
MKMVNKTAEAEVTGSDSNELWAKLRMLNHLIVAVKRGEISAVADNDDQDPAGAQHLRLHGKIDKVNAPCNQNKDFQEGYRLGMFYLPQAQLGPALGNREGAAQGNRGLPQ